MQIVQALSSFMKIASYIEHGGFESDLAKMQFNAAMEAFRKARVSGGSPFQLWSVINHLEAQESTLKSYFDKNLLRKAATRPSRLGATAYDLYVATLFMAVSYIYLDKRHLALDAVKRTREAKRRCDAVLNRNDLGAVMLLSPFNVIDMFMTFSGTGPPRNVLEIKDLERALDRLEALAMTMDEA